MSQSNRRASARPASEERSRRSLTRREAVGAAAVGATGLLSGCLTGVVAPVGSLTITGTAAQVTDQRTNVVVTVENVGDRSASGRLWARLSVGDTSTEKNREITVPAATEDAFTFEFDVTPQQFDYDAWIE
ncbi:hypothetical protein [Halospeciosus flavus]|uniref:Uncharacterized protein n=1 Tax=Halospeciosus flavus TaxID=3032283 RepID=A0ABD5Z8P3_9EURY|nr:hypothetical protein [Halospeciosus flavus]